MNSVPLEHNISNNCFKIISEGRESRLVYDVNGSVLTVHSTFVHPQDRGAGIAAQLTEALLQFAEEEGYSVKPACSYVDVYMKRKPEWEHLRAF